MLRLVGYARVSSESQRDNTSLESQEGRVRAYCQAMGHELAGFFYDVQSGKDSERPGFTQALAHLSECDGLIAAKLDRVGRDAVDILSLYRDTLAPAGRALIVLDYNLDTSSPAGRMAFTMFAGIAQMEREVIKERTEAGRAAKKAKGGYIGGAPMFGTKAADGELIPDESELAAINLIRRHYKSGKSFNKIARFLNSKNIPSKRGGKWSSITVARIVHRLYPNKKKSV